MIWQKAVLIKYGSSLKLELQNSLQHSAVEVVLPRLPDPKTLEEIKALIPYEVKFLQRIKLKTLNNIDSIFAQARVEAVKKDDGRNVTFTISGSAEIDSQELISSVVKELLEDGFYDSWTFEFDGKITKGSRAITQALATRSASGKALDATDLRIALESSVDVLDFINMI